MLDLTKEKPDYILEFEGEKSKVKIFLIKGSKYLKGILVSEMGTIEFFDGIQAKNGEISFWYGTLSYTFTPKSGSKTEYEGCLEKGKFGFKCFLTDVT